MGLTKENFEIPSEHFNDFYDNPFAFQNSASGESIQQVCVKCYTNVVTVVANKI